MRHEDDEPGIEDGSDVAASQGASFLSSRGDEASGSTSAALKASLTAISDTELCEVSLLDALAQAASDVLSAIPAERCIVYIYDKSAHLLRPQVLVDCSHGDAVAKTSVLGEDGSEEGGGTGETPLVSFPPVVGMVSSSFLQRRCLRMQEPNPHRTFHREYDAPKDLQVNSILCAPVILHRRATAVIQLLNRLDEAEQGDRDPFAVLERVGTPQDATCEGTNDVKLRRLKTIKPNMKFGFSSKDEQKLLHFTTHIAQTIEMSLKQIVNGRSQAKIREDKAKQAMDLLNSLNGKLGARVDKTEELVPTPQSDGTGRGFRVRRATLQRLPRPNLSPVDLLSLVVVVMQLQAMFRGRRERRAQKFAEALERYRQQRERVRSVMIIQRVTRRRKTRDKLETPVLGRSGMLKSDHHRENVAIDQAKKTLQSPSKPQAKPLIRETSTGPAPVQPSSSAREDVEKPRKKKATSAEPIQRVIERHQKRRQPPVLVSVPVAPPVPQLSDAFANIVKLQSFIRGSLVRKWLRRARALHRGPPVVCLRVASPSRTVDSNQQSHESPRMTSLRSQMCIYAMPTRPGKSRNLAPRRRLEEDTPGDSRTVAGHDGKRDTNSIQEKTLLLRQEDPDQPFDVQSRRLIASQVAIEKPHRDSLRVSVPPSKPRQHGSISAVWETARDANRNLIPPGVELAKSYRYRQHKSSATAVASIGLPLLESPGIPRLPAWRPGTTASKDALLCCLLPAQPKRPGGAAFTPPFPRPPGQIQTLQRVQALPKQGKHPSIKRCDDE